MKRIDKAIRAYMQAAKTGKKTEAGPPPPRSGSKQAGGAKRAAKLLMLLDKDAASEILKHLSENEVEAITREIADTGRVERSEAHKILDTFKVKKKSVSSVDGGTEMAKEMLVSSFGEDRGMSIYRRAVPIEIDNPLDFLDDLDVQQVLMLLKKEPPSVISVVMPYMTSRIASQVLESLPPELQMNVVKRIAKMEKISPDALMKVAEALREKIRRQGKLITEEIDGPQVLADILENMSSDAERSILENLDGYNPELVEDIRDRLFTIEVIFYIEEIDLQSVLREFSEEELAVLLKGKADKVRSRITENISERRRLIVEAESARLGAMKRRDVEKTTHEFVAYIRELEEEGKIVILRRHSGAEGAGEELVDDK